MKIQAILEELCGRIKMIIKQYILIIMIENSLLKSLTFDNYKLYKDKFWRAHELNMVNHQTKKSTLIVYEPYNFDAAIDKSLFNPNKLKRIR